MRVNNIARGKDALEGGLGARSGYLNVAILIAIQLIANHLRTWLVANCYEHGSHIQDGLLTSDGVFQLETGN